MKFEKLSIPDVIKITPQIHRDSRGEFMETFKHAAFNEAVGRYVSFLQENQSLSLAPFTVRGLHYQAPPFAQGKLLRCVSGEIIDIAVDIRKDSATYGQSVSAILSAENKEQLWIPEGFLHGFATLVPNTVIHYKCTNYFSASSGGAVFWNDPDLNLDWSFDPAAAVLSEKDKAADPFKGFQSPF